MHGLVPVQAAQQQENLPVCFALSMLKQSFPHSFSCKKILSQIPA